MGIYMEKYADMHELVKKNRSARKYYLSLPDSIQEQLSKQAASFTSLESMRNYAQDLLRRNL